MERRSFDAAYESSEAGKARSQRYNQSEKGKERKRRWKAARDKVQKQMKQLKAQGEPVALVFVTRSAESVNLKTASVAQAKYVVSLDKVPVKGEQNTLSRGKGRRQVLDRQDLQAGEVTKVLLVVA